MEKCHQCSASDHLTSTEGASQCDQCLSGYFDKSVVNGTIPECQICVEGQACWAGCDKAGYRECQEETGVNLRNMHVSEGWFRHDLKSKKVAKCPSIADCKDNADGGACGCIGGRGVDTCAENYMGILCR